MKKTILLTIIGMILTAGLSANDHLPVSYPKSIVEGSDFLEFGYECVSKQENLYYRDGFKGKVKSVDCNGNYSEFDKSGRVVVRAVEDFMPSKTTIKYITDRKNHIIRTQVKGHKVKNAKWDKGTLSGYEFLYNTDGWPIAYVIGGRDTVMKNDFDKNGLGIRSFSAHQHLVTYSYNKDDIEYVRYDWNSEENKMRREPSRRVRFDKYGFILEEYELDDTIGHTKKHTYSYAYYPTGELKSVTRYQDDNKEKVESIYIYNKKGKCLCHADSCPYTYTYFTSGELNSIIFYKDKDKKEVKRLNVYDENGNLIESQINGITDYKKIFDKDGNVIEVISDHTHIVYTYNKGILTEKKTYDRDKLKKTEFYDQYGNCTKTMTCEKFVQEEKESVNFTYFK